MPQLDEQIKLPAPDGHASPEELYVRDLVEEHRQTIPEEPLRLAIYLLPESEGSVIELVEIIDGFGRNGIADQPELLEVTQEGSIEPFSSSPRSLRLVLTNPEEVRVAFRDRWVNTGGIRDAVRSGRYLVVFGDPNDALLDVIRGQ
jgi:hypothetical protein